ncbi:MAG: NnrS family protein [Porticoccaceae bacterium]|nr:NnrS family protein [Porticoccaceae bacterium]MCK9469333.1 NnrS family protein [Porticoccaceae bacterium]
MKHGALLAYPFRLFFVLVGLYGVLFSPLWLGMLLWGWPTPDLDPLRWHVHEMLFGLVAAAIAGFLLTAMCNWVSCKPLQGGRLLALGLLWLAGRLVWWMPGLPPLLPMAVDVSFLLALTLYAGAVIIGSGNRRNLILVLILALLFTANLLIHLDLIGVVPGLARHGEIFAINLVVVLMVVVAGRITPAFTANWLERQGGGRDRVRQHAAVDRAAIAATALMIPADAFTTLPWLGSVVALLAALLHGVRLVGWGGWHCVREPLLWVLHLSYGWIVLALLLKGVTPWLSGISSVLWIHAAGVGAMGTLILGVMTRVSLGHTGRPLVLPRGAIVIYVLISVAAVARLLSALGWLGYREPLVISGVAFSAAFAVFLLLYGRILWVPRVDGRPG